jgi:hypothetical protein
MKKKKVRLEGVIGKAKDKVAEIVAELVYVITLPFSI